MSSITKPVILFRADSSFDIGTGHVMRCITLALEFRMLGFECQFLCRAFPGNLISLLESLAFVVHALPFNGISLSNNCKLAHSQWLSVSQEEDFQECTKFLVNRNIAWIVVDHYGIDTTWEARVKEVSSAKLLVIDDLVDREHACDVLLDQTYGRQKSEYETLVLDGCKLLLGAKYSLLRPEFVRKREESLSRRKKGFTKNILISMGGVDKNNVTKTILEYVSNINVPNEISFNIVLGHSSPWIENIKQLVAELKLSARVLVGVENMADLMCESDLAIGAAGATSWERCCMGLPSIIVIIAPNQVDIAQKLSNAGAAAEFDINDGLTEFKEVFLSVMKPEFMTMLSIKAAEITDGKGASYVINELMERKG